MMMGKQLILIGLLTAGFLWLAGCGGSGSGSGPGAIVAKSAVLSGGEQIPPVAAEGEGSGTLRVNTETGSVSGGLSLVTTQTQTVLSAHVHEGARGTNGHIVVSLDSGGAGAWNVPGGASMSRAAVNAFSAGNLYFDIHTPAFPGGELRGQIDR